MKTPDRLRIVYLEDDQSAFELVRSLLEAEGLVCDFVHVLGEDDYRAALAPLAPDAILSDFNLPMYDGLAALELRGILCPEVPFIFVSGALGESKAIELLKSGVTDFVFKDALPRLVPTIRRCLAEAKEHRERKQAEHSLRESEARFRRLAENAPDVIFRYRVEPSGFSCDYISAAVERISGYRPEEFYASRRMVIRIAHPDDQPILLEMLATRKVLNEIKEIRWIARDGRTIVTEQRYVPVLDESGRLVAVEGIARDITAVVQEEERRRSLEAQLVQAQKMESIGTLAGGIAHDFNNILTGILGFTEIARMSLQPGDEIHGSLDEVRKAGLRARDLVAQILTFSRQKETRHVPLDLARAVAEALNFLRASAPATVAIERRLVSGTVLADPTQIHQVMLNLCTNALHAMRDRQGELFVSVEPVAVDEDLAAQMPKVSPGNYLCVLVRDNGHGMDEATLRRVFDPFFTTKKPGEGTGLGLAVVQGIVSTHGGGIILESKVGVGTTFRIYLPVSTQSLANTSANAPVALGRGERVLVVDDESSVGTFTGVRLEQLNYRVRVFQDPRRALAAVRADLRAYDVLVTDLTMPGHTGIELIREVRAARALIPAVIVSGNSGLLEPEVLKDLGRVAVLAKPFTGEELSRVLRTLLDQGSR